MCCLCILIICQVVQRQIGNSGLVCSLIMSTCFVACEHIQSVSNCVTVSLSPGNTVGCF